MYMIGSDVMLDNMLVYPIQRTATNPVLAITKDAIDYRISWNCSMISIMLDIHAY